MCELSLYQFFLQGVGLVTLAVLIGAAIFVVTDPDPVGKLFDDEKKSGKK
jgi:hypothetical protein